MIKHVEAKDLLTRSVVLLVIISTIKLETCLVTHHTPHASWDVS